MLIFRHPKEILVESFPTILRYSIPLILPQERLLFKSHHLILEVPQAPFQYIDLDELNATIKKPAKKIFLQAECPAPSFEKNLQMS